MPTASPGDWTRLPLPAGVSSEARDRNPRIGRTNVRVKHPCDLPHVDQFHEQPPTRRPPSCAQRTGGPTAGRSAPSDRPERAQRTQAACRRREGRSEGRGPQQTHTHDQADPRRPTTAPCTACAPSTKRSRSLQHSTSSLSVPGPSWSAKVNYSPPTKGTCEGHHRPVRQRPTRHPRRRSRTGRRQPHQLPTRSRPSPCPHRQSTTRLLHRDRRARPVHPAIPRRRPLSYLKRSSDGLDGRNQDAAGRTGAAAFARSSFSA